MGNNSMGMSSGPRGGGGASLSQGKLLDAAAAAGMSFDASSSSAGLYSELLPAGCAPDAYKLFVGNVPKTCTEEELRPVGASLLACPEGGGRQGSAASAGSFQELTAVKGCCQLTRRAPAYKHCHRCVDMAGLAFVD
jgi:hypothetical protein